MCEFGEMSISKMPVADFQGSKESSGADVVPPYPDTCGRTAVAGPDVPRTILEKRVLEAETEAEKQEAQRKLEDLLSEQRAIENSVRNIATVVTQDDGLASNALGDVPEITDHDCYYAAVDDFHDKCYNLGEHEYAMSKVYALANLCEMGYSQDEILQAIHDECTQHPNIYVH